MTTQELNTSPVAAAADRSFEHASSESLVLGAIVRMEQLLDEETAALRSRAPVDLRYFNERKSHAMLELSRMMRILEAGGRTNEIAARLDGLRAKLETNRSVLRLHVEAVREVSAIISRAIRDFESDGTYSRSCCGTGSGR